MKPATIALASALLLLSGTGASADNASAPLPQLVKAGLSKDDAAAAAQRITGGRVLSVEHHRQGDKDLWRVKVLTPGGDVRVIYIDAETGNPA